MLHKEKEKEKGKMMNYLSRNRSGIWATVTLYSMIMLPAWFETHLLAGIGGIVVIVVNGSAAWVTRNE